MAKYAADRVRQRLDGLAGRDPGLRRVPRPQVRPVHDPRLLQLGRLLRRREGDGRGRPGADARSRPPSRPQALRRLDRKSRRGRRRSRSRSHAEQKKLAELEKREIALLNASIPRTLVSTSVAPRVMRVLPRGNWLDESGRSSRPACRRHFPPLGVTAPARPARPGPLAGRARQPAGRPGVRQPALEAVLRPGAGHDARRLRLAGRLADASRAARLAGGRVRRQRLGRQAHAQADGHVARRTGRSSGVDRVDSASAIPPTAGWPGRPLPARRRDGPRQRPGRQRPARPRDRRAERQAVPAARLLGVPQFPQARVCTPTTATNQYRRGLYTYWQRTFLHPSLLAFDAPTREECTVERPRSNTPLQALVLLNDPTYVEAARVFAARMIREGGHGRRARLERGFRLAPVATAAARGGRGPARSSARAPATTSTAPTRPPRRDVARRRRLDRLRRTSTRPSWRPGPPSPACS